ncbi:c6 transcription [Fusarium circinatum]|uniref:C6 transcription n=1 Tax=Fusarium circinatum TaxID=48490 RepID=A0A8H5TAR4_FUSCI|nr:c6 transcription [Fusarium circinatum]
MNITTSEEQEQVITMDTNTSPELTALSHRNRAQQPGRDSDNNQQVLGYDKSSRNSTQTNTISDRGTSQPPFGLSWPQAAQVLSLFHEEFTSQFPFVTVGSHHTAESLHKSSPFLFRAIMIAAAPLSEAEVAKARRNILAYLSFRVMVEEDKTLDILQGVLVIIACMSTRQSRRNPLDIPYMETYLKIVSQAQATPSDPSIEYIVRFVQMGERLSRSFGKPHERTLLSPYAVLLEGTGSRFRNDLSRLAESVPNGNIETYGQMFELYRLYLLVRLFEPAIIVACHPDEGVPQFVYLLTCLSNCLGAIQSFFDILLDSPADLLLRRSILTYDQIIYVMLQAAKLLLVEIPDWDTRSIRQTLDLTNILDQMVSRYEAAERLSRAAVRRSVFSTLEEESPDEMTSTSKLAKEIRWLKCWLESRFQGLWGEVGEDTYQDALKPTWSLGLLEEMPWKA